MDPTHAALIGTALGAVSGIAATVWATALTKKSEELKHLREMAFQAGVKTWEVHMESAKRSADMGITRGVDPIECYILNSMLFSEIIRKDKICGSDLLSEWQRISMMSKSLHEQIRKEANK